MENTFGYFIALIIGFIIAVYITRWIFGIDKIIARLDSQNQYMVAQMRMMKKLLIDKGVPAEEVDRIIREGNNS